MISAKALIEKFQIALSEQWGYIWGQSGAVWTEAKQKSATRSVTVQYGARWIGKRVADCSGLFVYAFRDLGGSIYHGSNTIWRKYCTRQGTLDTGTEIKPGTAVFLTTGNDRHHIGLYVGDDTVIEAKGTRYGVVTSKLSHWDEWGELKGVDYDEATTETAVTLLQKGSKGDAVKTLQQNLLMLGYTLPRYGADGSFGSETVTAVKRFQQDHGISADGIVGEMTQTAIAAALLHTNAQPPSIVTIPATPTIPNTSANATEEEEEKSYTKGEVDEMFKVICDRLAHIEELLDSEIGVG